MILIFDDGAKVEYEITRKNIKNINIRVNRQGVFVSAPKRVSEKEIIKILKEKEDWIINAIIQYKKKAIKKDADDLLFDNNEVYYLFGKKYNVIIERRIYNDVEIKNNTIFVYTYFENQKDIRKFFSMWEKEKLKEEIRKELYKYNELLSFLGIKSLNIKLKKMKSCWGVCAPKKRNISINIKLIHYDKECLDYILVHELCHIKHANHSKEFYSLVKAYMPDYKIQSNKLNYETTDQ